MDFPNVHFIREILVADYRGVMIPTMQSSESNTSALTPDYRSAAFYEETDLRTLYHHLGGSRGTDSLMGSTVVLPHRTRWASLWKISPGEVRIIAGPDESPNSAAQNITRRAQTHLRDQQNRD